MHFVQPDFKITSPRSLWEQTKSYAGVCSCKTYGVHDLYVQSFLSKGDHFAKVKFVFGELGLWTRAYAVQLELQTSFAAVISAIVVSGSTFLALTK